MTTPRKRRRRRPSRQIKSVDRNVTPSEAPPTTRGFYLLCCGELLRVERVLVEPTRESKQDLRGPVLLVVGQGGRQGDRLIQ